MSRARAAIAGLVFIAIIGGVSVTGIAYGFGAFSTSKIVTATIPKAGPALGPGSEIQFRGVLVGKLGKVDRTLHDAVLTLELDPSLVAQIPDGVTVRLVPRSVFGDLYVDLVPPAHISGPLRLPAHLVADTSTPTAELNEALDAGYRLLTAVRPSELNATLTAIATALHGRGEKLGQLVDSLDDYTKRLAPHTDEFIHDLATVGAVADELSRDAPDLLRTLDNAIAVSQEVVRSQSDISKVLDQAPPVAKETQRLLELNRHKLDRLVHLLHPVARVLRNHQANLLDAVTELRAFLIGAAKALGHGPWLKVVVEPDLSPVDSKGYTAAECPRYAGVPGRNCPDARGAQRAATATTTTRINWPRMLLTPLVAALSLLVNP